MRITWTLLLGVLDVPSIAFFLHISLDSQMVVLYPGFSSSMTFFFCCPHRSSFSHWELLRWVWGV